MTNSRLSIDNVLTVQDLIDQNPQHFNYGTHTDVRPEYVHEIDSHIGDYVQMAVYGHSAVATDIMSNLIQDLAERLVEISVHRDVLTNDNVSNEYQYITQMSSLYAQYRQAVTAYYKFLPMLTERAFS